MKRAAPAKIQREIRRQCLDCEGGFVTEINGAYMRQERLAAHVTLAQAASACGIGTSQLSRMERGEETFQRGYVVLVERLLARRRRSGPE